MRTSKTLADARNWSAGQEKYAMYLRGVDQSGGSVCKCELTMMVCRHMGAGLCHPIRQDDVTVHTVYSRCAHTCRTGALGATRRGFLHGCSHPCLALPARIPKVCSQGCQTTGGMLAMGYLAQCLGVLASPLRCFANSSSRRLGFARGGALHVYSLLCGSPGG
jgi:hypothetical protein